MNTNKVAREELIRLYGKESMFKSSGAEQYIEGLKRIKTFAKFKQQKRYKGQKLSKDKLQYHHLKHKSEGGKATVENGALVYGDEHGYMHSLPRPQEELINNHIRQWKVDFMILQNMQVKESGVLEKDEDYIEIPVHTTRVNLKELEERRRRQEKRAYQKLRKEMEDR